MTINTLFCICTIFFIGLSDSHYRIEHHYAKIVYVNKEYITEAKLYNVKPNRTLRAFSSFYCQNFDLTGKSFKLNVHAFYEDQALRDTPLQFDMNICDSLSLNTFGAREILKYGNLTLCPIKKGCYALNNFSIQDMLLPPHLPLKKYLIKFKVFYNSISLTEVHWHGELKKFFKNDYADHVKVIYNGKLHHFNQLNAGMKALNWFLIMWIWMVIVLSEIWYKNLLIS